MHVAIVGAGSLGCVYGVRLAVVARETVSFVVRPARLGDGAMRLERIDGDRAIETLEAPARVTEVPPDADVVLVCVRGDQLDESLVALLDRGPNVPLVMLTPMMPNDYDRLRATLGARVVSAMPSVVSYASAYANGRMTTRYWLPRPATTLLEEPLGGADPALSALVRSLEQAKIRARFAMGVHEDNPATTIAFMPLAMGLDAAGGLDALLADDALLTLTLRAADEAGALAKRVGNVAAWASIIMKFVGPFTMKIGVSLGRKASPEAMGYVEEHFGRKVHAQNVTIANAIVELARAKGTPHEALRDLAARLGATT
jgi:ketopantoate reductase